MTCNIQWVHDARNIFRTQVDVFPSALTLIIKASPTKYENTIAIIICTWNKIKILISKVIFQEFFFLFNSNSVVPGEQIWNQNFKD